MSKALAVLVLGLAVIAASCGGGTTAKVVDPPPPVEPPPPPPPSDITVVNHIIYMMQENRSFDHYFGQINSYRLSQGAGADVDGTPANASQLSYDKTTTFTPFHMNSKCVEDLSSYWNESHNDWNHAAPTSGTPMMDGFAHAAGGNSRHSNPPGYDFNGQRVMGYYDETDLPYYYFIATQFAMSDRWFSPAMTNTPANRMYAVAGTSHGVVNKLTTQLSIPTIFDELEQANISWKIYVPDFPNGTSVKGFKIYAKFLNTKIVPFSEYSKDLKNDTLPQVALIERSSHQGLDEHPGGGVNVEKGAAYVASIINALMASNSWKDSVFFLTFDEAGGFYDHVPPIQTVSPDGILPILGPNDTCTATTGPTCDFVYTGFRMPNFVVSPFAKPHYVDHTLPGFDTTAILKFIELRFGLKPLTARDAAQPDISFFFDFTNKPNLNPPTPPPQPTSGPCYITSLP
jgi:phospholipase C